MSHTEASTQPAPRAGPFTAAITGMAQWRTAANMARTMAARSLSLSAGALRNSCRSSPAQKALLPVAPSTTQCTSLRWLMALKMVVIS